MEYLTFPSDIALGLIAFFLVRSLYDNLAAGKRSPAGGPLPVITLFAAYTALSLNIIFVYGPPERLIPFRGALVVASLFPFVGAFLAWLVGRRMTSTASDA